MQPMPTTHTNDAVPVVVYMAGKDMDSIGDADVAMAEALAEFVHVLWIDPPESGRPSRPGSSEISPNLTRVRAPRRRRFFSRWALDRTISRALADLGAEADAVILADPMGRFPTSLAGHRLFYVTDDWVSGAPAVGLRRRAVRKSIEVNAAAAHTVAAVSETLALRLHLYSKALDAVRVVAPGCTLPSAAGAVPHDLPPDLAIALLGPLVDGLDYDVLDAVADTGHRVLAIGAYAPGTDETARRLDAFLARPTVQWIGERPDADYTDYLASAAVGIAPYIDDPFDRARFPSHILQYLAAGLFVVTTDLPATRWLDSDHVSISASPQDFARRVSETCTAAPSPELRSVRRDVAAKHTWTVRATMMLRLMSLHRALDRVPSTPRPSEVDPSR